MSSSVPKSLIEGYLDCVSPWSYFAFVFLKRNESTLKSHGVEFEFNPVFLGGINQGSGNRPPWMLPAKAAYSPFDIARAKKYFNLPNLSKPDSFPIVSLLPQRCLCYIKEQYSKDKFEAAFQELWVGLWEQNMDISKPEVLADVFKRNFATEEVELILKAAANTKYKQKLTENTRTALDRGAFGAPFFYVTNDKGQAEPFFGSDRFHFMWEYLGLPWSDISIKEKSSL